MLPARGAGCGKHRTRRLMRQNDLVAKQKKRYKRTITIKANPAHQPAPNVLQGDFAAEVSDSKRCADITYIPAQEGWLYLVVILVLFSRRIVGWAMVGRMKQQVVCTAQQMTLRQ